MTRGVQVGAKLRKADAPGFTLEVTRLVELEQGPPHARTRVKLFNHDLGERLYSVSALADPRLFVPVSK